ncbi:MAG TPA: CbiX/SirB N-terminal domain-containing protein [Gemmatimonadaceae bacterium]|jgi:sirohydrochlorin ferrochelatase
MNLRLRECLAGVAVVITCIAPTVRAQGPMTATDPAVGVLVVAHGSDAAWNAPVDSLAAHVQRHGVIRGPVSVAFLMGDEAPKHRFQDAVADLVKRGARRVVVVPVLVSSYSGHYDQIRYLAGKTDSLDSDMMMMLHMSGIERPNSVPITVTPGLDDSPELARVLTARAEALAPDAADRSHRALFLFGHGPNSAEDYAAWMKNLRVVADSVRAATGFANVAVELVRDDAPAEVRGEAVKRAREIVTLQHAATNKDVVIVPILVSTGAIAETKLPGDLAGLPAVYSPAPLLPDANLVQWVERRVLQAPPR